MLDPWTVFSVLLIGEALSQPHALACVFLLPLKKYNPYLNERNESPSTASLLQTVVTVGCSRNRPRLLSHAKRRADAHAHRGIDAHAHELSAFRDHSRLVPSPLLRVKVFERRDAGIICICCSFVGAAVPGFSGPDPDCLC